MEKPPVLSHKQIQKWVETQDANEIICLGVSEIERRAQRDADVEWLMSQAGVKISLDSALRWERQQARQETAREIFEAYDAYIKLLGEEIDTLAPLAIAHGWRSVRQEAGEKCRQKIEGLKAKYIK
jgi:hypothetical protein